MKLNSTQLELIRQYQAQVNSTEIELTHAKRKLDAFVLGVLSSNGVVGNVQYQITGDDLQVILPEPPPIPEE